ncbi:MAG: pyridoxamine 5'-phosphate oxidase family protein [Gammaproteobacteria bacterium]|jgi:hypothetical protein|nr:MAG: pyridoxamine 5'-phosphate oxidase family protein [Gammaproteobacteria bacterium]
MAKVHPRIDAGLQQWIARQKVFFVATAPLSGAGHINCSPRGGDFLRVLDDHTVAWLDLTGSGAETIAHLKENGRIVIMFCAFSGPPKVLRLHGRGEALPAGTPEFSRLRPLFPDAYGDRAIIRVDVERISDSCGYGVPLLDFRAERDNLDRWTRAKDPEVLARYQADHNTTSIDGLPGLAPSEK